MSEKHFNKNENVWFVYLIETHCGKIYTGITTNLLRRWKQHNKGIKANGARFLQIYPPKQMIYWEHALNHSCALKRERIIKKFTPVKKRALAHYVE